MIIRNTSKKSVIVLKARYALSFKDRLLGFLIKQNVQGLVFKTRFGIHTFGMQYPIDVLILDRLHRVVKIKKNLKPNRIFFWDMKYFWVIEMPKGAIARSWTTKGDQIYFDMRG